MGIGKTGECTSDISQIKNHACCEKYFKENKHNNLEWQYAHIFVLGHNMFFTICHSCSKQSETVRFSEQIMSADKNNIWSYFRAKWRLLLMSFYFLKTQHYIQDAIVEHISMVQAMWLAGCSGDTAHCLSSPVTRSQGTPFENDTKQNPLLITTKAMVLQ